MLRNWLVVRARAAVLRNWLIARVKAAVLRKKNWMTATAKQAAAATVPSSKKLEATVKAIATQKTLKLLAAVPS